MSYVIRDPLGPALLTYASNKRFRHRILKYWPTKTVDDIKVFDKLIVWDKHAGVLQDEARLKIYRLLNISIKDLEANDYTGLDRAYLKVPAIEPTFDLTDEQIEQYLKDNSPQIYPSNKNRFSSDPDTPVSDNHNPDPYQNNPKYADIVDSNGDLPDGALPEPQWDNYGWITDYVVYQPEHLLDSLYSDKVTDEQILNFVKNMDPKYVSINGLKYASPIFFAALKDTGSVLYEKKYTILKKELTKKTVITKNYLHNSQYSTESLVTNKAIIKVEYRRIADPSDDAVSGLINSLSDSLNELNTSNTYNTFNQRLEEALKKINNSSNISKQLKNMYYKIQGYNSANVNYGEYIRYNELEALTAKNFTKVFIQLINFGYDETPATFWEKATSVLITIVTFIAVAVLIYLQQYWAVPLVLSAGALGQGALAGYWARQGKYAAASYAGGQAQFLANSAEISGYVVAIYQEAWLSLVLMGVGKILEENHASRDAVLAFKAASIIALALNGQSDRTKQAVATAGKDTATKVTIDSIKEIVAKAIDKIESMTIEQVSQEIVDSIESIDLSSIINKFSVQDWLSLLNVSFQYYTNYMNPPASTDDMTQKITAQEKELASYANNNAEAIDVVERQFSDPYDNYIDGNSRLQRVPMDMTHGLNVALMNKYYNSGY